MKRKRIKLSKAEKRQILEIQGEGCLYCGRKPGERYQIKGNPRIYYLRRHWDHIIPWVHIYQTANNMAASCNICNSSKSDKVFYDMRELIRYLDIRIKKRGIVFLDDNISNKKTFKGRRSCPVCSVMFQVTYKHRSKKFCSVECAIRSRDQDYLDLKETEQIIQERKESQDRGRLERRRRKEKELNNLTGEELLKNIEDFIRRGYEKEERIKIEAEERRFMLRRRMAKRKYIDMRNRGVFEDALYNGLSRFELSQKNELAEGTIAGILVGMDFTDCKRYGKYV